eukprot:766523-Hanusia_phi.AAC.8
MRFACRTIPSEGGVLGCGVVWKLGKMWRVASSVRLWRERYLVVRGPCVDFFHNMQEWQDGKSPLKSIYIHGARVEKQDSSQEVTIF